MAEQEKKPIIKEKIALADMWFYTFDAVGKREAELEWFDEKLLREVLGYFGADFEAHDDPERTEALRKLKQSTNKWRRPGMA